MTGPAADTPLALAQAVPEVPADTVFFGSDPAGLRACLAMAALTRARAPLATPRVHCNRPADFAREYGVPALLLEHDPGPGDLAGAPLVFCGTSHPDSSQRFELHALAAAAAAGIRSIAFVDHWTNFRLRFQAQSGGLVLPDELWVLDAHAVALAVADGLPRERLRVTGSPSLAFLARLWRPSRSLAALRSAALPQGAGPILLYAPDPLSLRQAAAGFDEVSAARDLAAAVRQARPEATVLLRFHPLQPAAAKPEIARSFAAQGVRAVSSPPDLAPAELCLIADVVIGFHSNLLLEAQVLGRPVVRYLPGPGFADPLGHLTFGRLVTEAGALAAAIGATA